MKHYLLHFAAVYSIALVLLITVLVFGLNLSGLVLIPTLVACVLISVGHFVKKEQRVPNNHEKIQLVWGSSAVAIIVGSFFVLFLVLMKPN
ncbi:MAG: ABZJ_00895 family protein, partial [Acinetobacter johnsonii]